MQITELRIFFFKFSCILQICEWFFMHYRNPQWQPRQSCYNFWPLCCHFSPAYGILHNNKKSLTHICGLFRSESMNIQADTDLRMAPMYWWKVYITLFISVFSIHNQLMLASNNTLWHIDSFLASGAVIIHMNVLLTSPWAVNFNSNSLCATVCVEYKIIVALQSIYEQGFNWTG